MILLTKKYMRFILVLSHFLMQVRIYEFPYTILISSK